jgi:hypothetical protein
VVIAPTRIRIGSPTAKISGIPDQDSQTASRGPRIGSSFTSATTTQTIVSSTISAKTSVPRYSVVVVAPSPRRRTTNGWAVVVSGISRIVGAAGVARQNSRRFAA